MNSSLKVRMNSTIGDGQVDASRHLRPTTVAVIGAQRMMASGLASVLGTFASIDAVGCSHTIDEGVRAVIESQPDVVVLDADIAAVEQTVARLRATCPASAVIVLGHPEPIVDAARSLAAGAAGFVLKQQPIEELVDAIAQVREGRRVIAPSLLDPMLDHLARPATTRLPDRQLTILRLIAAGHDTRQIADRLGVTVSTLRNQIQSLFVRLGAHSKLEAVAIARRSGLLDDLDDLSDLDHADRRRTSP